MLIAAVRSLLAYFAVSLFVLVTAPIGMLLALTFGWTDLLYVFGHAGAQMAMTLVGIRFKVAGRENLPQGRAAVFCANHQSNVDPPVLFRAVHPRLRVLYKQEIDRIPLLARAFRMAGFIPIDRHNKESAMRSIEMGANALRAGESFLIFPEGTRSKTDQLLPFKKGGIRMAIRAGAPVVPVAISGGRAAMVRGSFIIRPATLTIRVGRPVETHDIDVEHRDVLIERVRHEIATLLALGPL
ncbi:MAG TPA: lysophospholipid acyltransferase family protein [Vicinamibacterales bacterium]|nr:lysophospholipid acyltransferase family protein [Vicinamibacterales bacterium]